VAAGRRSAQAAWFGVALVAAGCATTLAPAPEAIRLTHDAALAAAEGLRLVARAEAWQGMPPSLDDAVTPMLVTIANHGDHPVRIAYERLRLIGANGRAYRALAPQSVEGSVTVTLEELGYPSLAFEAVPEPHISRHILGAPPGYGTIFWAHPAYRRALDPRWREVRLPTPDMLRKALPAGVLEPGGRVAGFVYFEHLPAHVGRFELHAGFAAAGGEGVIRLKIPFVVS
jgi:hypothetical protein